MERPLNIDIIRHAAKDTDGMLPKEGIETAKVYGRERRQISFSRIFCSEIQRSIDTANLIASQLENHPEVTIDPRLSEDPYTDEAIAKFGLSGGKWLLLKDGNDSLPPVNFLSGRLSEFILEVWKENSQERGRILAISHVPPIMAFLGDVLANEWGKKDIDEEIREQLFTLFGGNLTNPSFVKSLEGFELTMSADKIALSVADQTHNISREFLENLSQF